MQRVQYRLAVLLAQGQSIFCAQLFGLAFDLVDLVNLLQRELRELALVCCVQVKEFAACVGQAFRFRDALGKAGLVAAEVVAYQTTSPFTEEATSVLLFPGLSMGTGISSACRTLLWSISALSASTSGCSCTPHTPTHCASVERGIANPARAKMLSCRFRGKWSAYLATSTCASRPAVGMPLSITCASTGACVMVSHSLQAHLPRMWRSTVKTPGT